MNKATSYIFEAQQIKEGASVPRRSRLSAATILILINLIGAQANATPPLKVISSGPDLATVLIRMPVRNAKSGILEGAELQGEVTNESVAELNGWRSMRVILDISCLSRRDRVRSMVTYSGQHQQGAATVLEPPRDWIVPNLSTYGGAVISYFCGARGLAGRSRVIAASEPAATMFNDRNGVEDGAHIDKSALLPSDLAPRTTATNDGRIRVGPQLSKEPSPELGRTSPLSFGLEPRHNEAVSVQVASSTNEKDARETLARLQSAHATVLDPFRTLVEPAEVRGVKRFRAIIVGFVTVADAKNFCEAVHPDDGCVIRSALKRR